MPDDSELRSVLRDLTSVVTDLVEARGELTTLLISEHRAKVEQWAQADPSYSERAKERLADFHALDLSLDILKVKGEIAQLTDRREYLLIIIDVLRSPLAEAAVQL